MIDFKQPSTQRGIALLVSGIAALFGFGDLFNAEVTDTGVKLGGIIGATVGIITPLAIGVYDAVRDEFKDQ